MVALSSLARVTIVIIDEGSKQLHTMNEPCWVEGDAEDVKVIFLATLLPILRSDSKNRQERYSNLEAVIASEMVIAPNWVNAVRSCQISRRAGNVMLVSGLNEVQSFYFLF